MIYTVTLNPAIDKTVQIDNLQTGEVNRVLKVRQDPGGKGINVSKVIASLGGESVAMGLLAGRSGQYIDEALQESGIATDFLYVEGETRTNLKIIDAVKGENTDINEPGITVSADQTEALLHRLLHRLQKDDYVVLAGSLPKGAPVDLYADWIRRIQEKGARVILDADKEALREGIKANPYMIKPNDRELEMYFDSPMDTMERVIDAGKKLHHEGISNVVISLGGDGALFVQNGRVYHGQGISVPVGSTVGAGDSMVAALCFGMAQGMGQEDVMKLALATSAANVMCDGSQPAEYSVIEELLPRAIVNAF